MGGWYLFFHITEKSTSCQGSRCHSLTLPWSPPEPCDGTTARASCQYPEGGGVAVPPLSHAGLGHLRSDTCFKSSPAHSPARCFRRRHKHLTKQQPFSLKSCLLEAWGLLHGWFFLSDSEFKYLVGCGVLFLQSLVVSFGSELKLTYSQRSV